MTFDDRQEGLQDAGYQILNDVVLNQVLVKFKTDELTERIIKRVQDDGTCWCGGTQWQGHTAMRISVSSWATKAADVEQSLDAEEQRQLEQSEIQLIRTVTGEEAAILGGIETALIHLQDRVTGIYLHIDMDAFEVGGGAANHYGATGGISPRPFIPFF